MWGLRCHAQTQAHGIMTLQIAASNERPDKKWKLIASCSCPVTPSEEKQNTDLSLDEQQAIETFMYMLGFK